MVGTVSLACDFTEHLDGQSAERFTSSAAVRIDLRHIRDVLPGFDLDRDGWVDDSSYG